MFDDTVAGIGYSGEFELQLHPNNSLETLELADNPITSVSTQFMTAALNLNSLDLDNTDLRIIPDMSAAGQNQPTVELGGITNIKLPVASLQHMSGGQVQVDNLQCDSQLCWYLLGDWPFTIHAQISCNGNDAVDVNNLTASDLHCSGGKSYIF